MLIARVRRLARPIARFGCVSIGTVYVLVGVLALLALSGRAMGSADEERMIHVLRDLPGGSVVIWGIIAGMLGYVLWRMVEAWADPYGFGREWKGLVQRTGIALSALAYGFIAWSAVGIARGPGGAGNGEVAEDEQQRTVAEILSWPAGDWWIGTFGLAMVALGVGQVVLIVRRSYATEINLRDRSPVGRAALHALAWYGYAARGVILSVLGALLIRGAWTSNAATVGDTDTAFDTIGGGLVGDSAFFVVALGTIAYGLFMYACAMFYKFEKRG